MRIRRVATAFMLAALVMGSLLTGNGTAETVTLLPSLTRAALLEIAQIAAPPAGVGLQIHADFPEGAPLVACWGFGRGRGNCARARASARGRAEF